MYAILNYYYGHKLEACLGGKPTSELKSRSLLCNYHKKEHFKKKKGRKVDIYFNTIKGNTVSPYCPHSPNPYSIRLSATSQNPREPIFQ